VFRELEWDVPHQNRVMVFLPQFPRKKNKVNETNFPNFTHIQVSLKERSIFWEAIVSVILSRVVYIYMCRVPDGFPDGAISLYIYKIIDNKRYYVLFLMSVFIDQVTNVGTPYLVKYIFEKSTVNISALCNSCEDMACCSSVRLTHCSSQLEST
jgi:hypothetical protein